MIKFIGKVLFGIWLAGFVLMLVVAGYESVTATPEDKAAQAVYEAARIEARDAAAHARDAARDKRRVAQLAADRAALGAAMEAARNQLDSDQVEADSIQFCRDTLFERYKLTGGVSYDFGRTVYMKKGYGALVVGTGTANSGKIRFKCVFDDRPGTRTLKDIQVTAR